MTSLNDQNFESDQIFLGSKDGYLYGKRKLSVANISDYLKSFYVKKNLYYFLASKLEKSMSHPVHTPDCKVISFVC